MCEFASRNIVERPCRDQSSRLAALVYCVRLGAGGPPGERSTAQPDATTEHLNKNEAMTVLAKSCACQPYIRDRVFEFWKEKRKRAGKASMRRLQVRNAHHGSSIYTAIAVNVTP